MAAEVLASNGCRVDVVEQMPSVGRKLLLAGRGGLNLTHSEPLEGFMQRYGDAPSLLQRSVEQFGPDLLREWCEGLGQPTFVGSSGRVFPESFRANALLSAWVERLERLRVQLRVGHRFVDWSDDDRPGSIRIEDADGVEHRIDADAVVMSLGGASWPRVGSDGAWVGALRRAGATVHELRASNVGVEVSWSATFASRFAGTPIKNIAVSCAGESVRGELMVTEHGLEGGAAYALSRSIRSELDHLGAAELTVDLRPDLAHDELVARLDRRRPKDSMSTVLTRHGGLAPVAAGLMRESTDNQLPVESRPLAELIRATPVPVSATAPLDRAISSAGGVSFDEVDSRFMLKQRAGTFIAGEMLDWDAPTGGYLLQATFSTAVAAANGALSWMEGPRPTEPPPAGH